MKLTYCDGWFHSAKRPGEVWSAERAQQAHASGNLYTVVIGDLESPICFVDVRLEVGYIGVSFLDAQRRVDLFYQFDKHSDASMFLGSATTREYASDTSESPALITFYKFAPSGRVLMRKEHASGLAEEAETERDLSNNWEPVPAFGGYEGIARRER
jgi:hypothetical protein